MKLNPLSARGMAARLAAVRYLKAARDCAKEGDAPEMADAIRRAIKSAGGAVRHGERRTGLETAAKARELDKARDPGDVLDNADVGTVLAALRHYQAQGMGDPFNRPADIHEIATDGGRIMSSLDDEGIDSLCERLNSGGWVNLSGPLILAADLEKVRAADSLIRQALAYEAEQFDGDPDLDLQVSGADLVDWFTGWRDRIRTAIGEPRPVFTADADEKDDAE